MKKNVVKKKKNPQKQLSKTFTLLVIFICITGALYGQVAEELPNIDDMMVRQEGVSVEDRLLVAISNPDYPVTPGDIYQLIFLSAGEMVTQNIIVESNYTVDLNIFGKINASKKSFAQLKPLVEERILNAYPQSMPSLTLSSVGLFQVIVKGDLPRTRYATAWGLSRLSELIHGVLGPYSSIREIGILGRNGVLQKYDLYLADAAGDINNDPLIRPGDTIIVYRRGKEVIIIGEVNKPGRFQLKKEDTFKELLQDYAKGITFRADLSEVRISRIGDNGQEYLYMDLEEKELAFELKDNDVITIGSQLSKLPVVIFEGAVLPEGSPIGGPAEERYNRITMPFSTGATMKDMVRRLDQQFAPKADLKRALLMHDDQSEAEGRLLDLEKHRYGIDSEEIILEPFDRIVIPLKTVTIPVVGSVAVPGSYNYWPDRLYTYYVDLAGGTREGTYLENIIKVFNDAGEEKDLDTLIVPGDRIVVEPATVVVSGAVVAPGKVFYSTGKSYIYYVDNAGGAVNGLVTDNLVTVFDSDGREKSPEELPTPGDRIQVEPQWVTVMGAVLAEGRYPYSAGKGGRYYLSLAGGIDQERNGDGSFALFDNHGNEKSEESPVAPDDRIVVESNSFSYNFNRSVPVITSALTLIAAVIALINTFRE